MRRHAARTVALGCLAVAACAPAIVPSTEPPTPEVRRTHVLSEDAVRTVALLLRMEDRRELDAQAYAAAAAHPDDFVRGRAVLAAGRIGGEAAALSILPRLADPEAEVRANAAFALGLAGLETPAVIDALFATARDDPSTVVAREAIHSLGRIGGPRAAQALGTLLSAAVDDGTRLGEILLAIWRAPVDDLARARLHELAASPHYEIRWRATYALTRSTSPASVPVLIARLEDEDPLVRSLAARALRASLVDSAAARAVARPILIARATDPHPHVRIAAARALGAFREPTTIAAVAGLLADPDSNVVYAAVEGLAAAGPGAVVVLSAVADDPLARMAVRAAALQAVLRQEPPRGSVTLERWAFSTDWLARLYAARALATAPWAFASPWLNRLARDADVRVAASAYASLAAAAPPGAARTLMVDGLAAPDPIVRAGAIAGIARDVQPADLPLLLEAYAAAENDANPAAAVAALDALAALAAAGTPVERAFAARFSPPPHPVVRRHAAQRITPPPWTWRPIETDRSIEWYEQVARDLVAGPLAGGRLPRAVIHSAKGEIVVELAAIDAPLTVRNFVALAETGYYDRGPGAPLRRWHRVVPNFVLQDGDPRGDGLGGPGYAIRDEINRIRYARGMFGMALAGPDTGGSQFFITHSPQPHLDGGYTIFGYVVEGMNVADAILQDDEILSIRIERDEGVGGS